MLEKSVENDIKKYLLYNKIYYIKIHGSRFMVTGIPDIIACYKGRFIGIEGKAPGKLKNQSDSQKINEENIVRNGGIYLLTDNLKDVVDLIEKIKKEEI